jgi:prevent-host-death family protein
MTMKEKARKTADRSIPAGEFKAKCLGLLDEVARKRKPVLITKRGKPIAKLVPVDARPRELVGYMKGTIKYMGDVVSPLEVEWEAMR